ncbi:MAG: DEAD/DEAH box helicase family protein [Bacteroidales bacterium]|nr:DEAD/DEAH box helicase family protein [Bacteroidales bacterium]
MGYKSMTLGSTYESGVSDVVEEFYTPVLGKSVRYDRIAGFFSSSCLAVVARGMSEFITNGGKMRLITSPRLNSDDASIIQRFTKDPDSFTAEELGLDVEHISDEFVRDHVKAMGWMLQQGLLDIRLALVCDSSGKVCVNEDVVETGLFHQKVGIFTDQDGDQISFSGSINESASAWISNDEEFKVFKAWDDTKTYFESDRKRFEEIWNGQRDNVKIFNLPSAVKNKLIVYSKDFNSDSISLKKYLAKKKYEFDFNDSSIPLFYFQADALNKWKSQCNCRQLFEMATGCGKTRTAIAGVKYLLDAKDKLVVIVSTPQNTLTKQWIGEFDKLNVSFDEIVLVDGTNHNWRTDFATLLRKNNLGISNHVAIFTTHTTASSGDFITIIKNNIGNFVDTVFVGDETHWLGAGKLQRALLPEYQYRIGLSATPSRWFDDEGTALLSNYYGDNHFEFSIKDALMSVNPITSKHFLVKYYYYLSKVGLTREEGVEYGKITQKLKRLSLSKKDKPEEAEKYNRLLEKRADIIKNAENKYKVFDRLIKNLKKDGTLEDLIIFVSPQQIDNVLEILKENGVKSHKLTQKEGTKSEPRYGGLSERQYIISKFKEKEYQALVAIKCLDEGIDIPTACRGIMLASSSNPREYVQRIGRIIRQDVGKNFAYLYDFFVDSICDIDGEKDFEKKIREKEVVRIEEIAANAINSAEITNILLS